MRHVFAPLFGLSLSAALLAGCAVVKAPAPEVMAEPGIGELSGLVVRPQARPEGAVAVSGGGQAARPPAAARTVEQFDTTTEAQRAEAASAPVAQAGVLGETVASLGDVAKPGFWLETPLVSAPAKGSVTYKANGKSVQVDLLPIAGEASAGSRISLAAMRVIEAPLTELPELIVHRQ